MKKHLVMIVGGYYPMPSATGKCAEELINLIHDKYDVDVICLSRANNTTYQHDGKNVYPVGNWYSHLQYFLKTCLKTKTLYYVIKSPVYLLDCFRHPNNLHWYVRLAYKKLKMINKIHAVDIIFSVGAPIASHCAAMRFKQKFPHVHWVTYSVDSYAAQNNNYKKFCVFERTVLQKADYNLLTEEIYDNSKFLYKDLNSIFAAIPYLLPKIEERYPSDNIFDTKKINLVYAGSFYKEIRNPVFLLNMVSYLKEDIILHLYCSSDCDDLINMIINESHGRIIRHKMVDVDEIKKIYSEADVLINVGNSLPEFKPSKTFEYIATRKPIINIYYDQLRDEVLEQYPLILQICNTDDVETAAEKVERFVRMCSDKMVSKEDILKRYGKHLPNNIINILDRAMQL